MAESEPALPPPPGVPGVAGVVGLEEGAPPPQRLAEVENALSVLQREAGLTEDTLKVLRKAVSDNLSQSRAADTPCGDDAASNGARKRPFKPSSSKRQQLTAEEAAEIYKQRPQPGKGGTLRRGSMLHCKQVAPKYGVTPKTIRDVWSGRSWAEATRPFWTEDEKNRRNANEEDSKHSLERNGMPQGMHPDDPSRMTVPYHYMPGMGSCGMVGGHMLNWGGAPGANGGFQPPTYMPSVALANMGLGIMGHTLTGMSGGFNLMGQGGGQMDSSVMQGRDGMGQHQHPGGPPHPMGHGMNPMHPGMMPPGGGGPPMNNGGGNGMGTQVMGPGPVQSGRTSDSEEFKVEASMGGNGGNQHWGGNEQKTPGQP